VLDILQQNRNCGVFGLRQAARSSCSELSRWVFSHATSGAESGKHLAHLSLWCCDGWIQDKV